ncbi:MAG TPA: aminotransferase class I/II-fold pyridoxal phosphate-dependent enzyme, partial [Candidatus Limnocylindrales bacterium]
MSPTPISMSDPLAPASYSWEATDEEVARRSGLPIEQIVRFDLNTSPAPPALVADLLARGEFETSLSEYPPSDYRRLTEAAALVYAVPADEILVGAGADEILDLVAKAFLQPSDIAVIPTPSYAM